MIRKPVLLDLFCGAGGLSKGYMDGGFHVIGVDSADLKAQYIDPENFYQGDALKVLDTLLLGGTLADALPGAPNLYKSAVAAYHASPPCQGYSATKRFNPHLEYPKLIEPVRERFKCLGRPYVIENVETAPLYATVTLCGGMFPDDGLRVYRHRIFETNFPVPQPVHRPHFARQAKMGRQPAAGEFMHVVGHFPNMMYARKAMGISWMRRDELAEAVPPAYSRYLSPYALAATL